MQHATFCSALCPCCSLWLGHPSTPSSLGRHLLSFIAQLRYNLLQEACPDSSCGPPLGSHPAMLPSLYHEHTRLGLDLPINLPTGLGAHGCLERVPFTLESHRAGLSRHLPCLPCAMKEPLRLEPESHNPQHSSP